MRAEWRAEQDAATSEAQGQWERGHSLVDWLTQRMHAGDRVAVTVLRQRFSGTVAEVSADLVALNANFGRVDIQVAPGIPVRIELDDHPPAGGRRSDSHRTFREALLVREDGAEVSVGTLFEPEGVDGTLTVGADYVRVTAKMGLETVAPIAQVGWICARRF